MPTPQRNDVTPVDPVKLDRLAEVADQGRPAVAGRAGPLPDRAGRRAAAGAPHRRARLQGRRRPRHAHPLRRGDHAGALPQRRRRELRPRRRLALRGHGQGVRQPTPRGSPSSATTRCCSPARTPPRSSRANKANSMAYQPALEKIAGFDINWNIVAYPGPSWAKLVFPDDTEDVAVGKLADAIFAASRVDIARSRRRLGRRTTPRSRPAPHWLNGQRFAALHFTGPGTDLTVGLADGHEWQGGASTAKNGITCNPNIPTEEVFTTPHARRVERPRRQHQAALLSGHADRRHRGALRGGPHRRGQGVARRARCSNKVLDTDEGARRLGEVALVPHSSPISKSGLLFYNTLFDENAACHIALGQCYSNCFVDGGDAHAGADRGAGRQQEPHPHRLDDRLGQDRHRRRRTPTAAACRCSARASGRLDLRQFGPALQPRAQRRGFMPCMASPISRPISCAWLV